TINGYGKAAGLSQLAELGTIESPLLLTSTLSVGPVWEGGLQHLLAANPEAAVDRDTVNVIVGECFDGWLSDARALAVRPEHALEAIAAAGGLGGAKLEMICDVAVPFERAAELFAPQKGADPASVAWLTRRLVAQAGALARDPRGRPLTGAAGGLSGGLWAAHGARLVPGAAYVLGALGFDRALEGASAVVSGEGRLDEGSFEGKLVGEIARRCRAARVPLHVIAGQVALSDEELQARGIASAVEAPDPARIEGAAEALAATLL
ncbi:MAG: glycerate kinase, partial [Solirubrobacterales bacterium]